MINDPAEQPPDSPVPNPTIGADHLGLISSGSFRLKMVVPVRPVPLLPRKPPEAPEVNIDDLWRDLEPARASCPEYDRGSDDATASKCCLLL
jgi:hypothetical protein